MLKIDARNPKESAKDYVVRQLVYNIIHINLIPGQRIDADELTAQLICIYSRTKNRCR